MKAAVFHKVGQPLEIIEKPRPIPAPGQVLLKVIRSGICGTDIHMTAQGGFAPPDGTILGHEFAGEVIGLGEDVADLRVGSRVTALPLAGCGICPHCQLGAAVWCEKGMQYLGGAFAQYVIANAQSCLVLPDSVSDDLGALVEPLAVALHGVRMAPDLAGKRVTILGAGAIGLGVVYWAGRLGSHSIDVIETNPARAEIALAMGATSVAAPARSDGEVGMAVAANSGSEVVFECVGKPGLLSAAIAQAAPKGTVVSLGFCMEPETVNAASAAQREVTLKFPLIYTLEDYRYTIDALAAGGEQAGQIITEVIPLSKLPAMFESLRQPQNQCKVLIDPWS